jgi:hypothetical protein
MELGKVMERLWLPELLADKFGQRFVENYACSCKINLWLREIFDKKSVILYQSRDYDGY